MDWGRSAVELERMVRAFSPRPGARTTRGSKLLKVLAARADKKAGEEGGIPGQIVEAIRDSFAVEAGCGRLLVLRVQPAGRTPMSAADYVKGYHLGPGERLGVG